MKDTRFKELLNLHLDQRMTDAEASELELAIQQNAEQRRIFRSYSLMHQGCAELFRRSESDAPAPDALVLALREAEARMGDKHARRALVLGWGTLGATAGVAALVALVVARISQPTMIAEATPEMNLEAGTLIALAVTEDVSGSRSNQSVVTRRALPAHLTLAALGIAPEPSEVLSLSRWQLTNDASVRLAAIETPVWMQSNSSAEGSLWTGGPTTVAPFSARPINDWGAQLNSSPFQTASFTFER